MTTNKRIKGHRKASTIDDAEMHPALREERSLTPHQAKKLYKALKPEKVVDKVCKQCGEPLKTDITYCNRCLGIYANSKCFYTPAQKEALEKARLAKLEKGYSEKVKTSQEDMDRMIQEFLDKKETECHSHQ